MNGTVFVSAFSAFFLKGASKLWFKRCLVFIDEAILNKENEINRTEQTRFFCCKRVLNSLRICKKNNFQKRLRTLHLPASVQTIAQLVHETISIKCSKLNY